jgi:crotonobetainyl-CoA:carnitine CoA-transferase CaiB-like acyl-CoA transferase
MTIQSLRGIRVAAFTQFLLGPSCAQLLADLGADVVKVEQPGIGAWERSWSGAECYPGGVSAFFLLGNRNVRSVALDLKSAAGLDAARRLITESDIVVENFRPGVLDKLGLGYEQARSWRPDIIYMSGSGYGSDGPYSHLPGQDLLVQAESGLLAATGNTASGSIAAGAAVVDQHAAVLLAMATLAAVLHRNLTGEGQRVEVTMLQAALDLAIEPVVYNLNGAVLNRPESPIADTFHSAPYGVYPTIDGEIVVSMASVEQVSDALGGLSELQAFEDPSVAFSNRDEIAVALAKVIALRSSNDVIRDLGAAKVWSGKVKDFTEALDGPALRALGVIQEYEYQNGGTVRTLAHPVRYGAGAPELRLHPPTLGEHTRAVLEELGYSGAELAALVESGAASAPSGKESSA